MLQLSGFDHNVPGPFRRAPSIHLLPTVGHQVYKPGPSAEQPILLVLFSPYGTQLPGSKAAETSQATLLGCGVDESVVRLSIRLAARALRPRIPGGSSKSGHLQGACHDVYLLFPHLQKIQGPHFGSPYGEVRSIFGSILGALIFGNFHIRI